MNVHSNFVENKEVVARRDDALAAYQAPTSSMKAHLAAIRRLRRAEKDLQRHAAKLAG